MEYIAYSTKRGPCVFLLETSGIVSKRLNDSFIIKKRLFEYNYNRTFEGKVGDSDFIQINKEHLFNSISDATRYIIGELFK